MAVSLRTPPRCTTQPIRNAVASAATSAPSSTSVPSRNAATTPGKAAWDTASPRKLSPRSTTNTPITAVTSPTRIAAASARCMKPSVSGSSSRSATPPPAVLGGVLAVVVRIVHQQHRAGAGLQQMAAVGEAQHVGVLQDARRAVRHHRPIQADGALEVAHGAGQVVGAGQDGLAVLPLLFQEV